MNKLKHFWMKYFNTSYFIAHLSHSELISALEGLRERQCNDIDVLLITEAIDRLQVGELTDNQNLGEN